MAFPPLGDWDRSPFDNHQVGQRVEMCKVELILRGDASQNLGILENSRGLRSA